MAKDNIHAGHRQRLKERAEQLGIKNLPDHEILEILLGYCIPYKDTNALAHNLIDKFGGFSEVLGQTTAALCSVNGVSEHTAFLLKNLPYIFEKYSQGKKKNKPVVTTTMQAVEYFRNNFLLGNTETLYVVCLNPKSEVIGVIENPSSSPTQLEFDINIIYDKVRALNATAVIIFHTHPNGLATPSHMDDVATNTLQLACMMSGIHFQDHIIVSQTNHYSYRDEGVLDGRHKSFVHIFDEMGVFKQFGTMRQNQAPYGKDKKTKPITEKEKEDK